MGNRHTIESRFRPVTWCNVTAQYSARERELMRALPEPERWFVHEAKALFGGRLS